VADFTTFRFQLNTGTNGTPVWTDVPASGAGTGPELRFLDVSTAGATAGTVSPTAGANWLTNYQGAQGDNDFITAPFTPTAVTADQWNLMIRLFTGANMTPGTHTPVISCKYTWT
jgi:hypothetical protein